MSAVELTVPPFDAVEDLHGDPLRADLVLFLNGNQFMVVDDLIGAFRREHPHVQEVFHETLPPGVLAAQLRAGALRLGSLTLSVRPDLFAAGPELVARLRDEGRLGDGVAYASNELALLVHAAAAERVRGLADLGADGVRVAIPDPETEGIGEQAIEALRSAGGERLVERVFGEKRRRGETVLTEIHHRQSPLWLAAGEVDAAVVWLTEARHHVERGLDVRQVELPSEHNRRGRYEIALVAGALHPDAAEAFLAFMAGEAARRIYARFGFAAP